MQYGETDGDKILRKRYKQLIDAKGAMMEVI